MKNFNILNIIASLLLALMSLFSTLCIEFSVEIQNEGIVEKGTVLTLVLEENSQNEGVGYSIQLMDASVTGIPNVVFHLRYLTSICLGRNKLSEIPEAISQLTNLEKLYLQGNKISVISKGIFNLNKLILLYLAKNQIKEIPDDIVKLTKLEVLDIRINQISEIPGFIAYNLPNLRGLYIDDNPIAYTAILNGGTKTVYPVLTLNKLPLLNVEEIKIYLTLYHEILNNEENNMDLTTDLFNKTISQKWEKYLKHFNEEKMNVIITAHRDYYHSLVTFIQRLKLTILQS